MNFHRSETAMLRDRIEQLEEELRQLRETFVGAQDDDLRFTLSSTYKLPPMEVAVLLLLLRRRFVTREQLYAAVYGADSEVQERIFDVTISRLRKKTRIHIANAYKIGWWIPNREQVLAALLEGKEFPL
jgi:DNA-binding response OmpR family regulator